MGGAAVPQAAGWRLWGRQHRAGAREPLGLAAGEPRPGFRSRVWLDLIQLGASEFILLHLLLLQLPALRFCWLLFIKSFEMWLLACGSNKEKQL